MNKAELIADLHRRAHACQRLLSEGSKDDDATHRLQGKAVSYLHAAELAEQLDEPPAMAWQKPDRDGWAWVEALPSDATAQYGSRFNRPRLIEQSWGAWMVYCPEIGCGCESLDVRQVCYIPDPPPMKGKSDA